MTRTYTLVTFLITALLPMGNVSFRKTWSYNQQHKIEKLVEMHD